MSERAVSIGYVVCSLAAGAVVIGLHDQIAARLGIPDTLATVALVVSTLAPLLFGVLLRFHRVLGPAAGVAMALAVAFLQPRMVAANMADTTRGSDQAECLVVGLDALISGEWPYDAARMSKRNPLSCGPLWLVAHLPASAAGYTVAFALIAVVALGSLAYLCGAATVSRLLLMLALTPVTWLALIIGSDFLTFGLAATAVAAACAGAHPLARRLAAPASVLLAHFRLPFLSLPAAFFLRRNSSGRFDGVWLAAVTTAVSVAVWAVFYGVDSERFADMGPLHLVRKLESMVGVRLDRVTVIVALLVVSVVLAVLCSQLDAVSGTIVFTAALLVPMALANLYQITREGYPHWEGAIWLMPLIVLTAFQCAARPLGS